MSVYWFRTIHPKPVVMDPEGPTAAPEITITLLSSMLAFTIFFFGLLLYRYQYERMQRYFDFARAARLPGRRHGSRC